MAEITSEIVDGIKVWQVPIDKLAKASDIFSAKLEAIYTRAKEAADAAGRTLSQKEVSALRNHKELGMWFSGKTPLAVDSVNSFLTKKPIGAKRKILDKVLLKIPKDTTNTFGRKFFENIENAPREFRDWLDRLEGVSKKGTFWPEGMNFKGFKKYLAQDGYAKALEFNKALEAKLGFKFDVGHLWGALGSKGDRTLVGILGSRSEGKFSPQNIAPQPKSLKLGQLLDPKFNVITPNVPPFFAKAGYQIAGSKELLDVYGGGQGFSSSLADYLMSKSPNIEKLGDLPPEAVAYIAFGDPTYADFIGKTPEARYAQMFDPARRDEIWRKTADLAATAEDKSGPLKIIRKGVEGFKDIADANPLLKRGIKIAGAAGTQLATNVGKAAAGIDPLMIGTGIKGVISRADLPGKILSAKDAVEGTLGTAAWSSRLRPAVGTPAALLAISSAVGEMQAGGAKWMRELGINNRASPFGTGTNFPVNPFMSTKQNNKINGISLNDVKIEKEEENPLTIANN